MRWTQLYLVGYVIFLGGLIAAAWKLGVIEQVGTGWTIIGIVIAIGIGIMISVSGGDKKTIEIDRR